MSKIGFLGPEGSYTEIAAKAWKDRVGLKNVSFIPSSTIPFLIQSIEKGILDYCIMPLENSIEGNINVSMDALISTDVKIIGEIIIKIDHCLAINYQTDKNKINAIYSHPQALSQCYGYITKHFPKATLKSVGSTSEAARLIANGHENEAAICSKQAALNHNLKIIAEKIQDYPDNKTRFIVIGAKSPVRASKYKTSLIIALPENKPGGLYKVLKGFAKENINLTKIESRPTKKDLGDYLFFIECIGHAQDSKLKKILEHLATQTALFKVLGSYPTADEGN
jgi:prephenate dehydratase